MNETKEAAEADVALELLKLQRTFQDGMRRSDVKAFEHGACGERWPLQHDALSVQLTCYQHARLLHAADGERDWSGAEHVSAADPLSGA